MSSIIAALLLASSQLAIAQTATKPVESKPADSKPAESKPLESKDPAAAKPSIPPRTAAFASETTTVANGLKFAEGPLFLPATTHTLPRLLVCDLGGNSLNVTEQLTPTDTPLNAPAILTPSGNAAGSTLDADGYLLLARFNGTIARSTKALASLDKGEAIELREIASSAVPKEGGEAVKLGRCNDLVVTPWGDIYFTDFGSRGGANAKPSRGLFRLHALADGTYAAACVDDDYKAANGVAFDRARNVLYVADYGASMVIAYDVAPAGSPSEVSTPKNRRTFVNLGEYKHAGPGMVDGMKVDAATGNLLTTGPGGVWAISSAGTPLALLPVRGASNIGLGEGRRIYITAGDSVLTATLNDAVASTPSSSEAALPTKAAP